MVEQKVKGKTEYVSLGQALTNNGKEQTTRDVSILNMLFPELLTYFITPHDRENLFNINKLRGTISQLIKERRALMENDKNYQEEASDLLSILLNDEIFANDDAMVIDECITFQMAATQTTSTTISNLIFYVTQQPKIKDRVVKEVEKALTGVKDIMTEFTLEKLDDLDYLKMCFEESLRIEPPVPISSCTTFIEDVYIGKYFIKANEMVFSGIEITHHDASQW